jgi:hypothetical protein
MRLTYHAFLTRVIVILICFPGMRHIHYFGEKPETSPGDGNTLSSLTDPYWHRTLTRLVPRELVDEMIAPAGRTETRKNLLPARVMVYL